MKKMESEKHIVPEALGNKKLITKRVCEKCNNRLGSNNDNLLGKGVSINFAKLVY